MILTDILGCEVRDSRDERLGEVSDVRFAVDATPGQLLAQARLVGIVVSPRTASSFLGYERQGITEPWPVAQILSWWHRGSFLVLWEDLASAGPDVVTLRPGFAAYEPGLPR
jgi:sporulation protein YlmC with PRC-barrel domain